MFSTPSLTSRPRNSTKTTECALSLHISRMTSSNNSSSGSSSPPTLPEHDSSIVLASLVCLVIIIITSLSGNLLVVLAFRVSVTLREVTNYFIVSLAVADILVAGLSMPVWAAYLLTGPEWVFAQWLNKAWACVDILCGVASIMNLTVISLERCISISWPLRYYEKMTPAKAMVSIGVTWVFAVFMALLKVLILWTTPPPAYELVVSVLCFLLPLTVMVVSYVKIFVAARHQIKKMIISVHGKQRKFVLAKELKAAKTIAVVIGAFLVCWGPFFVLNLVHGFCESCRPVPYTSVVVSKWMHYVNSGLNPIIYACMNRDYRAAFKKLLSYSLSLLPCCARHELRGGVCNGRSAKEGSSLTSTRLARDEITYHSCSTADQEMCYVWTIGSIKAVWKMLPAPHKKCGNKAKIFSWKCSIFLERSIHFRKRLSTIQSDKKKRQQVKWLSLV